MKKYRATRLTLLVALAASLGGCVEQNQQLSSAATSAPDPWTAFQDGQIEMTCTLNCSTSYSAERPELKAAYEDHDWRNLADRVLEIGYDNDQSWFYLASAANGLGYLLAAEVYFESALFTQPKCDGSQNVCDGLDIEALAHAGLIDVHNQEQEAIPQGQEGAQPDEVRMVDDGGTFEVPVVLNGVITLDFIIDSGASDVSIPADVALTLVRTGTLQVGDFLGNQTYTLADGSTVPSPTFIIRSLKVGDVEIRNVHASVSHVNGSLLLGESFLKRCNSWSIDNRRGVLLLQ
jgi:clan AA aspartic protease (TIGR02281 family)